VRRTRLPADGCAADGFSPESLPDGSLMKAMVRTNGPQPAAT
jgi:hypothetical protein